jgi:hypothetical protein
MPLTRGRFRALSLTAAQQLDERMLPPRRSVQRSACTYRRDERSYALAWMTVSRAACGVPRTVRAVPATAAGCAAGHGSCRPGTLPYAPGGRRFAVA